ncbi:beta-1,3-galactosyltransferase 5-like isoform X3 [Drosophila pseudoobscura]|uniref:Hexosyltransferase n=2 Tax=Drosophila pseudoobscura pseudoobscura TaxID=46245 RepID=A0A6I8VAA8_DROPS|nr:beta-1,3-galactosyltransferase 5 isoform X3 [Drosophila pseudoobscura]
MIIVGTIREHRNKREAFLCPVKKKMSRTQRMRFFTVFGAVIIIMLMYKFSLAKEILSRTQEYSVTGLPMRHQIKQNVTNRSIYLEGNKSFQSLLAVSNQLTESSGIEDIKTILRNQLIEMKKFSSSIQTLSGPSALPVLRELAMKLYEPGHLNEEIDIQKICMHRGLSLRLLILITSAQSNFKERMSIRRTWMNYGSRQIVGMAFILGRTTNASLNESLNKENNIYGDMIRGHFIDSYFNLTLKTISMLEWADTHCPNVKFILKTDDDMFINVPKLLDFIDARYKNDRTIYGRLVEDWKPIRNRTSKYFVPYKLYNGWQYPPFTTGPAYLLTGDIVHELYVQSLNTYYIQLEDVFITGFVAKRLKIRREHANEFLNSRISLRPCKIRNAISVHKIKPREQYHLWRDLLDSTIKCK